MKYILLCSIWGSHSGGFEQFYLLGYNAITSETSVDLQRTIGRYIPEDRILRILFWMQFFSVLQLQDN
jgi:hypothetical protein